MRTLLSTTVLCAASRRRRSPAPAPVRRRPQYRESARQNAKIRGPCTIGGDVKQALGGVFVDLRLIATSPAHLKPTDAEWLVPMAGVSAGLVRHRPYGRTRDRTDQAIAIRR